MTTAQRLADFFCISERLETEERLTRTSCGNNQVVAAHSWNMAIMALAIRPYLKHDVNMERVLELCLLHDLPEAIAHDIPLHEQTPDIKAQKNIDETRAVAKITELLQTDFVQSRFQEYESRQTPEARLVKLLDVLDTGIQHMCAQDLSYVTKYDDGFYWKLFFSDKFMLDFNYEPIMRDVYDEIRARVEKRLSQEQNIDIKTFIINPKDSK